MKIDGRVRSPAIGSWTRLIITAAAEKPIDVMAMAHSGPRRPTSTPAMGAPSSDAMTCPLLSSAFARSQRCFGARTGNRVRAPLLLSGLVSDEAKTTASSSAGGSEWSHESPDSRSPVRAAIR